jgi:hypothetical protein
MPKAAKEFNRDLATPAVDRYGSTRMRGWRRRVWLAAVVGLVAVRASAREIRLPLAVEPPVIREALMRELFNDAEKRAVFWGKPGECSFFYLADPEVEGQVARLRVLARGEARLGTDFGAACLSPIAWQGFVELFERPRLDGWKLHFEVVDSNLLDAQRGKGMFVGALWDRMKESVQPAFGAVTIDLGGPFRDLRDFLSTIVAPARAEEARRAIESLRPVSVQALPRGIVVEAALQVADTSAEPSAVATEPPLSEAEIAAFTERANQWDAFVTFVIKTLGTRTLSKASRQALLETLLDARHQIADALAAPSRREDPVRQLFLKSWDRLRPVADDIARGLPGAEAVGVLTFLAAGDALQVLDQAGSAFGVEVSADGLRRMARMIAPGAAGDPLEYSPDVDPQLRDLLGFGAPLAAGDEPTSLWMPLPNLSDLFDVPVASAAAEADRSRDAAGWVVGRDTDLNAYLKRVQALLDRAASSIVAREKLTGADAELFRKLMPATAWQESCWRQFQVQNEKVTYLRSNRGSVGMLQVNERVWRGFYEIEKLRWKVDYNVAAGADVLYRYFEIAGEERGDKTWPLKTIARAIYAGYNGGPSQLRRYLERGGAGAALRRVVDQLFGTKFDSAGDNVAAQVATCLSG